MADHNSNNTTSAKSLREVEEMMLDSVLYPAILYFNRIRTSLHVLVAACKYRKMGIKYCTAMLTKSSLTPSFCQYYHGSFLQGTSPCYQTRWETTLHQVSKVNYKLQFHTQQCSCTTIFYHSESCRCISVVLAFPFLYTTIYFA